MQTTEMVQATLFLPLSLDGLVLILSPRVSFRLTVLGENALAAWLIA